MNVWKSRIAVHFTKLRANVEADDKELEVNRSVLFRLILGLLFMKDNADHIRRLRLLDKLYTRGFEVDSKAMTGTYLRRFEDPSAPWRKLSYMRTTTQSNSFESMHTCIEQVIGLSVYELCLKVRRSTFPPQIVSTCDFLMEVSPTLAVRHFQVV